MPIDIKIYESLDEIQVSIHHRKQMQKWIDKGEGIAIYILQGGRDMGDMPTRKYCSFGLSSSAIPDCDYPPDIMPRMFMAIKKSQPFLLVGYIPKRAKTVRKKP